MSKAVIKTHTNDKFVWIYRKDSFIGNAQAKGAPEFMAMSKKSLGSYWENSYSKTIGSGLNFSEQRLLMPIIVDCEVEDRAFRSKVAEYFSSIKTDVPFEKGRKLNIGLENGGTELSKNNLPLSPSDYITYRHAINHPLVAKSKQDGEGDMLKEFYIFDPEAQEDFEVQVSRNKDKALELYIGIKKTPKKIDMLLTLLGADPRTFTGKNADNLKLDKLKSFSETKPDVFISTFEDKNFESLYVLQSMINMAVLKKIGERVLNPETGTVLGNTMEEAMLWLKDPANSETVVLLKARTQEGLSGDAKKNIEK